VRTIVVEAGEEGVFVVLRIGHDQRRRLYRIDSSERKGSAQLSELKSPTREFVLEKLRISEE
jgi:hypothetical protein